MVDFDENGNVVRIGKYRVEDLDSIPFEDRAENAEDICDGLQERLREILRAELAGEEWKGGEPSEGE